jgi:hypothetical protein
MDVFECAVGICATSHEWSELADHILTFGDGTIVAGDFKSFDTSMSLSIMLYACQAVVHVFKRAGASDEFLTLVRGALSDIVNPNINYEGDLYTFGNSNPSGQPLTSLLNSFANSIYLRYAYYAIHPNIRVPFAQNVKLVTYGDDNLMGVNKRLPTFNHTTIQSAFARVGISYTMADKESDSRPYITLSEASFLKREFRHHKELGCIVAALADSSIKKKHYFIKKRGFTDKTSDEQFAIHIDDSLREAMLWGREYYDSMSSALHSIALKNNLLDRIYFPTYSEAVDKIRFYYDPKYKVLISDLDDDIV